MTLAEWDEHNPRPYFCRCQHPMETHRANPEGGASCSWCPCDQYQEDRRLVSR